MSGKPPVSQGNMDEIIQPTCPKTYRSNSSEPLQYGENIQSSIYADIQGICLRNGKALQYRSKLQGYNGPLAGINSQDPDGLSLYEFPAGHLPSEQETMLMHQIK